MSEASQNQVPIFGHEEAGREFKSALTAAGVFAGGALLAHEAIQSVMPESSFRDASANTVFALGCLAGGTVLVAGSVSALKMRWDEHRYRKAARS